jgi:rhodanese-related sulfurtransferase
MHEDPSRYQIGPMTRILSNSVMNVKKIGTEQAKDILESDGDSAYIDVRTEQDFINGHVPRSINIPVAWPNASTRQMKPNPDFVKIVSTHFAKDARIIVGCQSGDRSKFAAELLARAGFQDLSNMQGGFGGTFDTMGRLIVPGWIQMGLPVETGGHADSSYSPFKTNTGLSSCQELATAGGVER